MRLNCLYNFFLKLNRLPIKTYKKPEDFKISYTFEAHIEGMRFELWQQQEIVVRQFLFTEEEITDDLNH